MDCYSRKQTQHKSVFRHFPIAYLWKFCIKCKKNFRYYKMLSDNLWMKWFTFRLLMLNRQRCLWMSKCFFLVIYVSLQVESTTEIMDQNWWFWSGVVNSCMATVGFRKKKNNSCRCIYRIFYLYKLKLLKYLHRHVNSFLQGKTNKI